MLVSGLRVLVIDDDKIVAEAIAATCRSWGLGTTTARTAQEAVLCLLADKYDCIVLDLSLPDTDGVLLVESLHARQLMVPAVVVTGRDIETWEHKRLEECGVRACLGKPFKSETLMELIELESGKSARLCDIVPDNAPARAIEALRT